MANGNGDQVAGLDIGVKAVTDGADGESAGDFNANLKRAARKAAEAMERLIEEIAAN